MSTVFRRMTGSGSKGADHTRTSGLTGKASAPRLVYVDDSRTSAYVVKRMLKPYGYLVDHFESAEPALIALIEQDYDLLLTDLKVSPTGMDGDDLVRALRASGSKKVSDMPVIVITGATDTGVLSKVYDAGANQIMTKPVNGEELDAHIRKLVFVNMRQSGRVDNSADNGMIVSFGQESKGQNGESVPVLSPASSQNIILKDDSRRTLARAITRDVPHPEPSIESDEGAPTPRPATKVRPAARVIPTIKKPVSVSASASAKAKVKEKRGSTTAGNPVSARAAGLSGANTAAATPVTRRPRSSEKNSGAQARKQVVNVTPGNVPPGNVNPGNVNPGNQSASVVASKANIGGVNTKRPVDPAVLKKVKAAATAKKIKLIALHKARLKAIQAKKNSSATLGLEPKQNEAVNVPGNVSDPMQPTSNARAVAADAARQAVNLDTRPPESVHTSELFGQQKQSSDTNILQQMDRFPLVQTELRSNRSSSGVLSFLTSIVELWGLKKLLISIVAIVVLITLIKFGGNLFSGGVEVTTASVEQGEIFQSITVPGKVVSKLRVDLTPSIAGRLTNVYVEEGDNVKKGELLARLDDREAKINLKRAEANYKNAKEDVALAERSLKRLRQAFSKGAVARQLVEEAEVELRSARARDSVAEEEVRTAKLSLENPRIVAPFAGTITARYVEVGQWVVPSETLFTLVDQGQREIEVQVDAADSGGIAVGQTVSISSDAFPGLNWPESVTRLAAATSNVGNANTVSVYVSLGSNAPSLRFGQQVDAEIRTAWNPSALKVPYGSIIMRNGKSYVAVVDDNFVNLVNVETGIEDFSHVEIRQGVSVGQSVILANGLKIDEGDRVVISSNN